MAVRHAGILGVCEVYISRATRAASRKKKTEDAMEYGGWIAIAIVVALVIWVIAMYNQLVALRNRFKNAFAQIDVQLKRRYDLIPNLVEAAKGYLQHERQTLEAVIQARSAAVSAESRAAAAPGDPEAMRALSQAEGVLGGALGRLLAVFEAYPDLKANQNIMQVQEELVSTENKVAFSRQAYNDSVMQYNTYRESFPQVVIAGPMRFGPAELLESTESAEERQAPKVSFQ
jgi:LemA protein